MPKIRWLPRNMGYITCLRQYCFCSFHLRKMYSTLSLHRHHHEHITDRQPQSHAVELDESMNWELQTLEGLACNMGCITCLTLTAHCFHHHSPRNVHDDNMKHISFIDDHNWTSAIKWNWAERCWGHGWVAPSLANVNLRSHHPSLYIFLPLHFLPGKKRPIVVGRVGGDFSASEKLYWLLSRVSCNEWL